MNSRAFSMVRCFVVVLALLGLAMPVSVARADNVLRVGPGQEYATIQDAVNAAGQGSRIFVYPATYPERVLVTTNNLQIIAQGEGVFVVPPGPMGAFMVYADHVTIQGFDIGIGTDGATSIWFQGSYNTFADNYIHQVANWLGLNALSCRDPDGGSDYNVIERNVIDTADLGIVIEASTADAVNTGNIIRDNTILNAAQTPIAIENGTGFLVSGNIIGGSQYGICIAVGTLLENPIPQGHHTIVDNTLGFCAMNGISLWGQHGTFLTHNRIAENTIVGCGTDCLALETEWGATMTNNEVAGNTVSYSGGNGILLSAGLGADVSDNLILDNVASSNIFGSGIYLGPGTEHNRILNNEAHSNDTGIVIAGDDNLIVGNRAHDNVVNYGDLGQGNLWRNNK